MYDYPPEKDFPNFRKNFGPRGVLHSWASDKDNSTEEPRWGRVGKQKIEDTGPLTRERMLTCDEEFAGAANRALPETPYTDNELPKSALCSPQK